MKKFSSRDCDYWNNDKSINPVTKKKISPKGKVSKLYDLMCNKLSPRVGRDFQLITYYYDPVLMLFFDDLEAMSLRESQLKKIVKNLRNVNGIENFYDIIQNRKEELNHLEETQKERIPHVSKVLTRINVYNKKMLDKNLITVSQSLKEKMNPNNYQGKAKKLIESLNSL